MNNIVIFGGGFIGLPLMRCLSSLGNRVVVFSRGRPPADLPQGVGWIRGDFADQQAVLSALEGASVAYHLIATTVPADADYDVAKELNENVIGAINLIRACETQHVRRLVFASSSSVYGIQSHFPISEDAQTNPISTHGIHKLTVEKFLLYAHHTHGFDVKIARISNPYGPGQNVFGRQGFIGIVIGNIIKALPVRLANGGDVVRDFVFIDDVVAALANMGSCASLPTILNIGSGEGHSLLEVVHAMEDILQKRLAVTPVASRAVDIPKSILDVARATTAIGYSPSVALRDGLRRTLSATRLL